MLNSIRISTLLIFIGINLRFATENIINAIIFFMNMESGSPDAPCMPDMCGDVMMVVIFAVAYMFITSAGVEKAINGVNYNSHEDAGVRYLEVLRQLKNYIKTTNAEIILPQVHLGTMRHIKNYIRWTKGVFFLCIIGFCLYLFSKYILTIGLEVLHIKNNSVDFILNSLNDAIKVYSSLVFVYVYCSYLSTNKIINIILYMFFFIRNIFSTNVMELITEYDTYIVVPFLDILTPIIIIYSMWYIAASYRTTLLYKIIGIQKK